MPLEKGGYYNFVEDGDWEDFLHYGAYADGHTLLGGGYYVLGGHSKPAWVDTPEEEKEYNAFWSDEAPYMIHGATYNWSGKYDIGQ